MAPFYDYITPKTTDQECRFLDYVFKDYKKAKIVKILDLGCGTGRHACALEKMGYSVTGIDLSKRMLKVARKKCPGVYFKRMDFTQPDFPQNSFDAAICMWSTMGYIHSKSKFKQFVRKISSTIKYLLILDSSNYENPAINRPLIKKEMTVKFNGMTMKTFMKRRYDVNTKFRTDNFIYTLIEKNKKPILFKDKDRTKIWPTDELELLLKPEFKILGVHGCYSLKERYSPKSSKRRIIIGERV